MKFVTDPDTREDRKLHLLKDFPNEIRQKIWRYVLVSPTGYVTLKWYAQNFQIVCCKEDGLYMRSKECAVQVIAVQLLRVCKQIYKEAEEMPLGRNMAFGISLTKEGSASNLEGLVGTLHKWYLWNQTRGHDVALQQITFVVAGDRQGMEALLCTLPFYPGKSVKNLSPNSAKPEMSLEFVKKLLGPGNEWSEWLKEIKIRVDIVAQWDATPYIYGQRPWVRQSVGTVNNLKAALRKIHDNFGGEMVVDGVLCYKDGKEIKNPFPLFPLRNGAAEKRGIDPDDVMRIQQAEALG